MPTIPASAARDLPAGIRPETVVWDETLGAGAYCARVLKRGTRLCLTNVEGDACANLLVYNADRPIERLNVADTVKVQWQAYPGKGSLLLSDMGRVLMSFVEDTCGRHDTFCGGSSEKSNARKYGAGANHDPFPNARDRFAIALAKFGLGRKDVAANINLFKGVRVEADGGLTFLSDSSRPGDAVVLRAEMNVLVGIANTPHVLDPRPAYTCTPVRVTACRGAPAAPDDPVRMATPEALRAFQNTEDYFLG
jgi:urea carboxylase-associated protein 2